MVEFPDNSAFQNYDAKHGIQPQVDAKSGTTPYHAMEMGGSLENHIGVADGQDDDEDDEASVSHSIISSVLTADGIHDRAGFIIVCLIIFIGDMSRGVMFPTLWPLVESLGGSEVTLGFTVSAFSFGRIIVSPIFGSWSVTYGYSKTLVFSCLTLLCGTILYTQVQNVGRVEFLIFAQVIIGIGSGTLGVTRAFVAEVSAQRNRTTYMAWIAAVQYTGLTVTSFIGAFFIYLMQDKEYSVGLLKLNLYTAPAYLMSALTVLILLLMSMFFRDRQRVQTNTTNKKKSQKRAAIDEHANQTTFIGLTVYDCCILGCMLLNVATKGSIACFETLGIKVASDVFGLNSSTAGSIVATSGTFGVIALLLMGYTSSILSDIQLICGGMAIMIAGILSLTFIDLSSDENPARLFSFAIFLVYAIGFPVGHTAVVGLFSKIVGRRPQGTLLGWFASAGSLARIIFPIMSGLISQYLNVVVLFHILSVVLFSATVFTFVSRKSLSLLSL